MEPIYVKSRWNQPELNPRVANYPKMLKPQNVKPLKKDLGLVDAFGVALNPKASLGGWPVWEAGFPE